MRRQNGIVQSAIPILSGHTKRVVQQVFREVIAIRALNTIRIPASNHPTHNTSDMAVTKTKIILDLCGGTGSWSKPYVEAGYDVRLVTLPNGDVRTFAPPEDVYGILAAPPCTEFSMAKHFHGKGKYSHDFAKGLETVVACLRIIAMCKPRWWAMENPNGMLKRWMGKEQYRFEPWEFGDAYQKTTLLWGKFSPPLKTHKKPRGLKKFSMLKSKEIAPEFYGKLDRTVRRSITPHGFAKAFFEANR